MMGDLRNTVIMDLEQYDAMTTYATRISSKLDKNEDQLMAIFELVRAAFLKDVKRYKQIQDYLWIEDAKKLAELVGYYPEDDPDVQSIIAGEVEELTEIDEGYQE